MTNKFPGVVFHDYKPYKKGRSLTEGGALNWANSNRTSGDFLISESGDVWDADDILDSQCHNLCSEAPFYLPCRAQLLTWSDIREAGEPWMASSEATKLKRMLGWKQNEE